MGEVAERYRHAMADSRSRVEATFARLEGKPWKQFRRHLAASAPPPAP
jgi:hypothetical protein